MIYPEVPVPIHFYVLLATLLFCIGIFGCLARRNAIAILMSLELMFNACNIILVAFCERHGVTFTLQAFSRAQDVLLLVGLGDPRTGPKPVDNVAIGWVRGGQWPWRGLPGVAQL